MKKFYKLGAKTGLTKAEVGRVVSVGVQGNSPQDDNDRILAENGGSGG